MATLERPLPSPAAVVEQLRSPFDPVAIPRPPSERLAALPPQWQQVQNDAEDDLIDLGQEQLFTGARTRRQKQPPALRTPSPSIVEPSSIPSTSLVSEEVYRSLGAAKHAFAFALSGLLQDSLPDDDQLPPTSSISNTRLVEPLPLPGWANIVPLRRHSIATTTSTTNPSALPTSFSTELPDNLLETLVRKLRTRTRSRPVSGSGTPPPEMKSLGGSPLLGVNAGQQTLLEELQARVDVVATELSPADAELAHSLVSLLSCIDRLLVISRVGPSQLTPGPSPIQFENASVYVTLERQARALKSAREDADSVMGAVREVEIAERDLLWGRVDDLSERVRKLCRQRADAIAAEDREAAETAQPPSKRDWVDDGMFDEDLQDLPRYSTDAAHHPPSYFSEYTLDSKTDPEKSSLPAPSSHQFPVSAPPLPRQRTRPRQISNVSSEKMQRDLDSVSAAIERLYLVSPQLANQRVEPDRRQLREKQLAKLGNAIERLSKGRFNDQRAAATPTIAEEPAEKARRIKRMQDAAMDKLIDQIDRAASRTLIDQRVEMKVGKQKSRQLDRSSVVDSRESQRREYILENTGKGRLASQDAVFSDRSRPASPSVPVTITEFFRSEEEATRPRSNSTPSRPIIKKRFSGLFQARAEEDFPGLAAPIPSNSASLNKKSLRLGVFKKGSTPTSSRRGSYDSRFEGLGLSGSGMSRSPSVGLEVHAVSPLDFIAEESRNLGTIVVTFWPRVPSSGKDTWEVLVVEGDSIVVAPTKGGPGTRIALPSRVIPQNATVYAHGTYSEVKLATVPPSPTHSRPDLEVHAPLSTAELREALPQAYSCVMCNSEIVDSSSIVKYNALPSEHWAELLDAWMCHQDQTLSDDLISKGKGIKPRQNEGLVGSLYVLLPEGITKNWVTPDGSSSIRSEADDYLLPANCTTCGSLVGQHVTSIASSPAPSYFRLLKYATYPNSSLGSPTSEPRKDAPRYGLACHLTAEMLEIGQAHACHRFVVEDSETNTPRLLLWLFNPAIRVSFASESNAASLLESGSTNQNPFEEPSNRLIQRSLNAVKVFYSVVYSPTDNNCHEFMSSAQTPPEHINYPQSIVSQLTELLQASSSVYPVGKRNWGEMDVGFLERI